MLIPLFLNRSLESLPSTARILQPKDQHIISTENFSISSSGFSSRSEHLYNIQQLLDRYVVILRLFVYLFFSFVALRPTFVSQSFSSPTSVLIHLPAIPRSGRSSLAGRTPNTGMSGAEGSETTGRRTSRATYSWKCSGKRQAWRMSTMQWWRVYGGVGWSDVGG